MRCDARTLKGVQCKSSRARWRPDEPRALCGVHRSRWSHAFERDPDGTEWVWWPDDGSEHTAAGWIAFRPPDLDSLSSELERRVSTALEAQVGQPIDRVRVYATLSPEIAHLTVRGVVTV